MHEERVIKAIKVIGVEKPQKGKFQQHFEYVIRVTFADGHDHLIFRRYSMLFDFHSVLKEVIKDSYSSMIILPELPVARFQHVGRKFLRLGMNKELKQMTDFCQKIIVLPKCMTEKDIILKFFDQLGTDIAHAEVYKEQSQKGEMSKDSGDIPSSPTTQDVPGSSGEISHDVGDQYRSIAYFDASSTGELSVTYGEIVTVIEKNSSGWWLVSNTTGKTGFTPATFLEPLEDKADNEEEWIDVRGPNNVYAAINNYEAQCPDEISFRTGEELEVIAMSNIGWWRVRRGNQVGLCPASSLTKASDSSASNFNDDAMNEFRKSILCLSKKSSFRRAPPRKSSTKSNEDESDNNFRNLQTVEPERVGESSSKYTKIIPKHLRPREDNNNKDSISYVNVPGIKDGTPHKFYNSTGEKTETSYVNVPVIKDGTPHYFDNSMGEKTEAIEVHVVRKDYEGKGLSLREGETVQVISVLPDGCYWKVATMSPPFRDGLIPADLLCPELLHQGEELPHQGEELPHQGEELPHQGEELSHSGEELQHQDEEAAVPIDSVMCEGCIGDTVEPVKVLPRFSQPPCVKKPVPKPRTTINKSSPGAVGRGTSVVALGNYDPRQPEFLAFTKGDIGRIVTKVTTGWWFIELNGSEGWVPTAYWKEVKRPNDTKNLDNVQIPKVFDKNQWFCGKMSRVQCEDHFGKRGKHLEFIVRESVQRVGSYVLSIKFNNKVHHFPIEKAPSGKLNIGKLSFDQLSEIVSYYTVHPLFFTDHKQPVSIGKPLSRT